MPRDIPFFIIAGNQRCGTNYMRDIFMRQTNIYPYGEVFFPDIHITHNFDGHFFSFYKDKLAEDKYNIFFNNPDIFDGIFEDYINEIIKFSPRKISCIDIKSDCFATIPRIYECIEKLNIKLLHIYRKDKIKRALSQAVLNSSFDCNRKFNPTYNNSVPYVYIDPQSVYNNILSANGFDHFVKQRYPDTLRLSVCYEDLISQPEEWEAIRSFIGFDGEIHPDRAFTKQQNLSSPAKVENHHEIIEFLSERGIVGS